MFKLGDFMDFMIGTHCEPPKLGSSLASGRDSASGTLRILKCLPSWLLLGPCLFLTEQSSLFSCAGGRK